MTELDYQYSVTDKYVHIEKTLWMLECFIVGSEISLNTHL